MKVVRNAWLSDQTWSNSQLTRLWQSTYWSWSTCQLHCGPAVPKSALQTLPCPSSPPLPSHLSHFCHLSILPFCITPIHAFSFPLSFPKLSLNISLIFSLSALFIFSFAPSFLQVSEILVPAPSFAPRTQKLLIFASTPSPGALIAIQRPKKRSCEGKTWGRLRSVLGQTLKDFETFEKAGSQVEVRLKWLNAMQISWRTRPD